MRDCLKNQRPIYQKRYLGEVPILDENGDKTGSFTKSYSSLITINKNVISKNSASSQFTDKVYGALSKHKKVISTTEKFPVGNNDLFWIDADPVTQEADFKVGGVYDSLNTLIVGLDHTVDD